MLINTAPTRSEVGLIPRQIMSVPASIVNEALYAGGNVSIIVYGRINERIRFQFRGQSTRGSVYHTLLGKVWGDYYL